MVLIDGIRALQPDLVAFAESIKNGEYDQVPDLLGPGFHVVHQKARDTNGMGISIASRWLSQQLPWFLSRQDVVRQRTQGSRDGFVWEASRVLEAASLRNFRFYRSRPPTLISRFQRERISDDLT